MDEFENLPNDDEFASLPDDTEIPKTESFLEKAMHVGRTAMGPQIQGGSHLLNTAAFGLPGLAIDKFAPQGFKDYIRPKGFGEQAGALVGDVGGFMVGGPEQLAAKGAERFLPQGTNFLARAAKGFGKGTAAVGSLEAPQVMVGNENPLIGAMKSAGGGVLQGAGESMLPIIGKGLGVAKRGPKYLQDVFHSPDRIKDINSQITQHEKFIQDSLSLLDNEAKNAVLSGKLKIQDVAKENSKIYRDILNSIDSGDITADEYINNVIKPSLFESNAQGLPQGAAHSKLTEILQKYMPKESSGIVKTDMLGMPIQQQVESPTKLSLNDIKNIKNSVYESMQSAAQSGSKQHIARDVTADIFSKNHGEFLRNRVPAFSELQSEYGPQIEAQRFGYEKFQPSESSIDKGSNVLIRAAKSKAGLSKGSVDQESLLSQLEGGTKRFKGTGSLRGNTEDIASRIFKSKKSLSDLQPKLDYAHQLRTVRDDIIKWGITALIGGAGYAGTRLAGNVIAHSTD